jgi:Fe-S-cluster containining protein
MVNAVLIGVSMFPLEKNPCVECGACCSKFRVSFYWAEADPDLGGMVPPELTDPLPPDRQSMKNSGGAKPRCIALRGEVGQENYCAIYPLRPSPCREFGVNWTDGWVSYLPGELERCNRARAGFGLLPLRSEESP